MDGPRSHTERGPWFLLFALAGAGNLLNGLWMLLAPELWFLHLPGAVPDFGPYNEHFVRDLGCMFATWGLAMLWAATHRGARLVVTALLTAWYGSHALVHVYDTVRGVVGPEHWILDLPLCYGPALLVTGMLVALRSEARRSKGGTPHEG